MKKSSILIAVFAVMSAASAASAGNLQINFDGRSTGAMTFKEGGIAVVPAATPVKVDVLDKKGEECELNRSIATGIKYSRENNLETVGENLEKLITYGTFKEKSGFITSNKYTFPERFTKMERVNLSLANYQTKATIECLRWGTEQVCVDKEKCVNVCNAGSLICLAYGAGGACAAWGPACNLVCSMIKDCHDITVCQEWITVSPL